MKNENRNKNGNLMEHHFNIDDAIKFGIEKAIIIYNFRFWLEQNKANKRNVYKHTDGKSYYWTYNSGEAYAELFPYLNRDKISRYLREMEKDKILISGNFNKAGYDRTKWYTLPALYFIEND